MTSLSRLISAGDAPVLISAGDAPVLISAGDAPVLCRRPQPGPHLLCVLNLAGHKLCYEFILCKLQGGEQGAANQGG